MDTHIHLNQFTLAGVKAERHKTTSELVTVTVTEDLSRGHQGRADITGREHIWQQVVDQLAAIGITPTIDTTPVVPRLAPVPDGAL